MQIAKALSLPQAREILESQELRKKVIEADKYAKHNLGIHGVPHFVIGSGSSSISLHGAQSTHALERALQSQME